MAEDNQSTLEQRTQESLAKLSLDLAGNPKTRKGFLALAKEVRPNTPIPEIDAERAVDERFAKEKEAREKFESEQRDRWLKEDLAKQKNTLKETHGLSDEDFTKMEEMMKKGELPADYRWAGQLFKAQTEAAAPTNYGSRGYEGPLAIQTHAKQMDGLLENEHEWSISTAHKMIDDMSKGKRESAF